VACCALLASLFFYFSFFWSLKMGYFSKTCAKTNLPVVVEAVNIPQLNLVVALYPDGRKLEGSYDGYGRVGGQDLMTEYTESEWKKIKFVLQNKYEGETYDSLGKSGNELGQGYFMAKKFLHHSILKGSYKDYAEYKKTFKKLAEWI
jgi:hypothetical protein